MSESDRSEMRFGGRDEPDLLEYRPVSRLALLALALGLSSSLALLGPLLLIVPAVTVVVAFLATWAIKRSGVAMIGRTVAIAGLLLALLFASWATARSGARQWLIYGQARRFSDHWMSLVNRGEFHQAHQLAMPTDYRQPKGADLAAFYDRQEKVQAEFDKLFGSDVGAQVKTYAPKYPFKFVENVRQDRFDADTYVVQLYAARIEEGGHERLLPVRVVVQRSNRPRHGHIHWRIYGLGDPNKKGKKDPPRDPSVKNPNVKNNGP